MDHQSLVSEILSVTAPVYILVFIGMFLKWRKILSSQFISEASNLVYQVTMPLLLFLAIGKSNLRTDVDINTLIFFTLSVIASILIASAIAIKVYKEDHQPVFVQGVFRGNHGIIALALTVNLFGDAGLALGGAMVAVAAVLNNALSPIVFIAFGSRLGLTFISFIKQVFLNPMVLGVVAGVICSLLDISLPAAVDNTFTLIASISLPVALLCIGASLSLSSFRSSEGALALQAAIGKLIIVPLVFVPLAKYYLDVTSVDLGVLFIFFAVPTAAVSYILAEVSGRDSVLASNIVVVTTFLSLFTISLGLYLLQIIGWV